MPLRMSSSWVATVLGILLMGSSPSSGSLLAAVLTYQSSPNVLIPDGDSSGAVFTIVASGLSTVTDVDVTLNLTGSDGFNGDFFAYLSHESSSDIAILLNRPGKDANNVVGTFGSGFSNVTFDDSAAHDVHDYETALGDGFVAGSALTGSWQPDARSADPGTVTSSSSRSRFLSTFNGVSGNGEWSLFVADLSEGGALTLSDWSITVSAVPEPREYLIFFGGGLFLLVLVRRL